MKSLIGTFAFSIIAIVACGPVPPTGTGGTGGKGGTGGTGGTAGTPGGGTNLPCDVDAVLKEKCQYCHSNPVKFGAPMPLVTYADTQAPATTNSSLKVWQLMKTKIDNGSMPQAPMTALSQAQKDTMNSWFASNAPGATPTCSGGTGGTGGVPGDCGDPNSMSSVDANSECWNAKDGEENIPAAACPGGIKYKFRAHAVGNPSAKYPVPNPTNDQYVCFAFKNTMKGQIATAFANVIDDSRVIHHWILYGLNGTPPAEGSVASGIGCQVVSISGTFVTGWAPGGTNGVLPSDVGMGLEFDYFQLQVHYNNRSFSGASDASGPSFCTQPAGTRPNTSGVITLGQSSFTIPTGANDYAVSGTCSNETGKALTVLSTSPHMHTHGTGFRTTHTRGGSALPDIVNVPIGSWVFSDQVKYGVNRTQILPGDTLKTTCYYDNPNGSAVKFGTATTDEMCYNFMSVYPIQAFTGTKKCPSSGLL